MEWKSKRMQRWDDDEDAHDRGLERKKFAWLPVECLDSNSWVWLDWYWYRTYRSDLVGSIYLPTRPVRNGGE